MSDSDKTQAGASAEEAYAKASENVAIAKPEPVAAIEVAPEVAKVATAVKIPSVKPSVKPAPEKPKVEPKQLASASPAKSVVAKAKTAPNAKAVPKAKPALPKAPVKTASLSGISPKIEPPKFTATTSSADAANKEKTMTTSKKVTTGFESIIGDAQTKAKDAFEKSTALFGDYADFTKGNIEAVVQSGKILAEGLQGMGSTFVAEGRTAFETASADIKGMAAAKSPTDLLQLQSEMIRKSFDYAVAYGSKNTEAMIKLASEAMSPISGRVSLAVEKVRTAAI